MKIGNAISNILTTDAATSALLGNRVSANIASQGTLNPCATYLIQHVPLREKDSFSTYDSTVILNLFSDSYDELIDLSEKVITALDRNSYPTENVTQIDFKDSDESFDLDSDSFQMTQIYTVLKEK